MAEQIYEMTYEGIKTLQDELLERKTTISIEIAERLKEARAQGDLSENSEYDDAKEAQAANEVRILEIDNILKNAKVIEDNEISRSRVTIGAEVDLEDLALGQKMTYTLVSAKEEDIFKGKISSESPVGAAILGHKKNEVVVVKTPVGDIQYKILAFRKPKK